MKKLDSRGVEVTDFNVKKGTDKEKRKEWNKAYTNLYKYYTI